MGFLLITPNPQLCARCGIDLKKGMVCWNHSQDFRYLEKDQGMHMECYIEKVIDEYLKIKK